MRDSFQKTSVIQYSLDYNAHIPLVGLVQFL